MKKLPETNLLRSKIMRSVKSKHTLPEISVRQVLRELGYYYRLHVKTLPGTPDIVIRKLKKIILVNGCFWHGHNCKKGKLPKSNIEFWKSKIERNLIRDEDVILQLRNLGWTVLAIWQCEIKDNVNLKEKLQRFLSDNYY